MARKPPEPQKFPARRSIASQTETRSERIEPKASTAIMVARTLEKLSSQALHLAKDAKALGTSV